MSPLYRMPPSAIKGMLVSADALAALAIAVNCGTPTPEIIRVVQIEPGPMPTLTASAPARIRSRAPSVVATFPAITSMCPALLDAADRLDDVPRMSVGAIDHKHIDPFFDQAGNAFVVVDADGRPDPQPSRAILARQRKRRFLSMSLIVINPFK